MVRPLRPVTCSASFSSGDSKSSGVRRHFASGDLRSRRALKAQVTDRKIFFFRFEWWPEGAADHWPMLVDFAAAGRRIERRTRLLIGKVLEPLFRPLVLIEQPSLRIARKIRGQALDGLLHSFSHRSRTLRRIGLESNHPPPQPYYVELADGEHADAALAASRLAQKPVAASSRGVGECVIGNLDQDLVAG